MKKENRGVGAPTESNHNNTNVDCSTLKCFVCDQLSVLDDMVITILEAIDEAI